MENQNFTIEQKSEGVVVVSLTGDLLGESFAQLLLENINDLLFKGCKKFLFDLSAVRYVNSSGIGVLITLLTKIRNKDGEMILVKPSGHFQKLLLITKLNKIFNISDSIEHGVDQLSAS
jgi:anti-sigma B factor antagonist